MYQNVSVFRCYEADSVDSAKVLPNTKFAYHHAAIDLDPEYDQKVGNLVLKLVSTLEKVAMVDLLSSSRGQSDICLARQMAMYLIHTVFSVPYHRVAIFLKRDRTTISHACRLVEDLRDNEEFDKRLETMENLLVSARALGEIVEGRNQNG